MKVVFYDKMFTYLKKVMMIKCGDFGINQQLKLRQFDENVFHLSFPHLLVNSFGIYLWKIVPSWGGGINWD